MMKHQLPYCMTVELQMLELYLAMSQPRQENTLVDRSHVEEPSHLTLFIDLCSDYSRIGKYLC